MINGDTADVIEMHPTGDKRDKPFGGLCTLSAAKEKSCLIMLDASPAHQGDRKTKPNWEPTPTEKIWYPKS
jgi:hypothetical protein